MNVEYAISKEVVQERLKQLNIQKNTGYKVISSARKSIQEYFDYFFSIFDRLRSPEAGFMFANRYSLKVVDYLSNPVPYA